MVILLRLIFVAACVLFGYTSGAVFLGEQPDQHTAGGALIGVGIGIFVVLVDLYFKKVTVRNILSILVGSILGLLLSRMMFPLLKMTSLTLPIQNAISLLSALIFSYLGAITILRGQDEFSLMLPFVKLDSKTPGEQPILLDTSVIIDGRIADICETAFMSGKLIVPRFVLKELQLISDSADDLKRNRGRRGLDVLNRIKNNPNVEVKIHEMDFPDHPGVDAKLVQMGKAINAKVFTNDFNLNKVCELQGVPVLNINELSNALKPIVMPGEILEVRILKEGKEQEQGVAYLDDGTMVVVDGGRRRIGQTIGVTITSVLQTSAGRMIFAKIA